MNSLSVTIGNLTLKNPVLVASGTFGYAREVAALINLNRLGGIITKAVTLHPRAGNPPPRIAETPAGMLNSIGLANVGVKRFIEEKLPFLQSLETAVFVNVAGSTIDEYVQVVAQLEPCEGIAGYEINVSCPNVKRGGLQFGTDAANVYDLTTKIRKRTQRTIIVKLTPNVTHVAAIAQAVEDAGADAISVINTMRGMAINIETRRPKIATLFGGLSGPAIKPIAIAKVYETYRAVSLPIIGMGGIMNHEDAIEFMLAGASAVQIGTATFIKPRTAEEIIDDLAHFCQENKIHDISNLVGGLKC